MSIEEPVRQVVVPKPLREQVMHLAHNSVMGEHIRKTTYRVLTNFYWPVVLEDVTRYCRSCDVCQRTVRKGTVSRAPLQRMPLIDSPFKRVAVDIVGPIHPASDEEHRYILTVVDFATRYPEAKALKHISTEATAEALVTLYSRLGIAEEILIDMGSQFVSEYARGVASS